METKYERIVRMTGEFFSHTPVMTAEEWDNLLMAEEDERIT